VSFCDLISTLLFSLPHSRHASFHPQLNNSMHMYVSALGIVDYLVYMLSFVCRSAALCWFLGLCASSERSKSRYPVKLHVAKLWWEQMMGRTHLNGMKQEQWPDLQCNLLHTHGCH
jgi:hypothetical protein